MSFDQNERALLVALADVLIPAADGMPSASQADAAGQWLDAVLTARPDLAGRLKDVLAKARDEPWSRNHPKPDIAQGDHRLAGIAPRWLCPERVLWRRCRTRPMGNIHGQSRRSRRLR